MNWIIRLGHWWETRRKITRTEHERAVAELNRRIEEASHVPQGVSKELTLLKVRLDRLELLTGLKREPEAVMVPGAARIG